MKPRIYEPAPPERLVEKAEEEHLRQLGRYNYDIWPDIIWQEERDGLLYTYIYDGKEVCDQDKKSPKYLIAADMDNKRWDTWSFLEEKWSKKMLESTTGYYGAVEGHIDESLYKKTLREMQGEVRGKEAAKRREKRKKEIEKDMGMAKELPPAFLAWAERQLDPYLVYNPGDGNRGYCTRCKSESFFLKKLENHSERTCPSCRARCRVKTPKSLPEMIMGTTAYIQRTSEGVMVRYVTLYKKMKEEYRTAIPDKDEMVRVVIKRGQRQKWYERIDASWYGARKEKWRQNRIESWTRRMNSPYRNKERFCGYLAVRRNPGEVTVYRKNLYQVTKGCALEYMPDWQELIQDMKKEIRWERAADAFIDLYDWIHRYPQTESLWKLGFKRLAKDIIRKPTEVKGDQRELHKFLGISKEMWRFLQEEGREETDCRILRKIRRFDNVCTDKKLVWEAAKRIDEYHIDLFQGLPLRKVVAYLKENKEQLYGDYIRAAKRIGYNLDDEFVAFPKNLQEAHDAAVEVQNEKERKEKLDRAKGENKGIEKVHRKISVRYSLETESFVFTPAASNYEIVKEGQTLHHCVGNGKYARKMIDGDSYIIFMRKKERREEPYYTIEIDPNGKVLQAYGKYDKKPDWEMVEPAIQQYSEKVRERTCQKAFYKKTGNSATAVAQTA